MVQIRVTPKTRNPLIINALFTSGVTWKWRSLNHAPLSLYTRPRTRFVAGFVGRTNLLDGTLGGGVIRTVGTTLSTALLPGQTPADGPVTFSVRPGSIGLHGTPGDPGRGWWVQGRVTERAYLGEHWDYVVRPEGSEAGLRVTAPPTKVLAVNDPVWLEIDPAQAALIPG